MHGAIERPRIRRLGFYVGTIVLVAIVWRVQRFMDARTFGPDTILASSSDASPSEWQQMAIRTVSETNSLLTTLGTAVLGGLGFLLGNRRPPSARRRYLWSAFASAVCVALSLYYGYVSHLHVLWMIKNQSFDPYSAVYIFPSHFQFYALLLAVFFFADFAVHDLSGEDPREG